MTSWVRLWRDMPTDPKFRAIAKRSGRPLAEVIAVFALMMTAADDGGRIGGWSHEDAAAALDLETDHVEAIHLAMQAKVLDGDALTGWAKRQPKREDDSRERVRAHRERKKPKSNGHAEACNADVTQGNAPETESETDSETEGNNDRPESDAAPETGGRTPAFADLKSKFNGSTETMLAFVESVMGPGTRVNAEQWLAGTVAAHGAPAVAQAFGVLAEKRAAGEISSRPLPHWSSLAAGMKGRQKPPDQPKKRTLADVLRERKEAAAQ